MLVTVRAVLQNGLPPAAGAPAHVAAPIAIPKGSVGTLRVAVTTPDGTPVRAADWTAAWTVKKRPSDSAAAWAKAGTAAPLVGPGVWDFAFTSADTRALTPGTYFYDIWLTAASPGTAREQVLPPSTLYLQPTVTSVP